ncbi:serine/threonine protein kinase [Streptomyces sp. NPDC048565]|uniref:serine/threonine protein kinase n=1 Tax=Streptomyces sp. NPDC048565 TaxID=3155266 RepID=UPI0034350536
MEHLRGDDPVRIGPYTVLGRFGSGSGTGTVSEPRYIARSADGDRTVFICLPRAGADPSRWVAEARHAWALSVPGFLQVDEVGGTPAAPWYAAPYVAALPLPDALVAQGGPLPEPFVRALGAALASSLRAAHAGGVIHAGLSPSAVLVTPGGIRLAGFGTVRSTGVDGEHRGNTPGLDHGSLPPEQMTGGRPRPLGDIHGIGAVLSYASTGHTAPEREEIPEGLRGVISACLARDPAQRPEAAALEAMFAAGGGRPEADLGAPRTQAGPQATVLDAPFAARLPPRVAVALARVAAGVLAAEPPRTPAQLLETHPSRVTGTLD